MLTAVALCCSALASLALLASIYWLAPNIVSFSPASGASEVHPGREIRVGFSSARWLAQKDLALELRDSRNALVPVAVSYDADERALKAKPLRPLTASANYRACVEIAPQGAPPLRLLPLLWGSQRCVSFGTETAPPERPRAGAPILIVTGPDNPFGGYYADIMRAEGLNAVDVMPVDRLATADISGQAVILLATSQVSSSDAAALESWARAGGSLIAMRPKASVMRFMGLAEDGPPVDRAYLLPSQAVPSVKEIAARRPLQIHGPVDVYRFKHYDAAISSTAVDEAGRTEEPAIVLARLYADRENPLLHPAATSRRVGRGYATAFAYDLALAVVYARQGNPAYADQERDGSSPHRPNDLFYPDYLDRTLVGVPQADEHQRLLANVIVSTARMPLPRFWYLPGGRRAAIVMVGDDHATKDGTVTLFDKLSALSPPGCRLDRWECLRATGLLSPPTELDAGRAEAFQKRGFEFGVHLDTDCKNPDLATLRRTFRDQLSEFHQKYPTLPPQVSNRIHCIAWNGWTDTATVDAEFGLRFDMNYYYWSPDWVAGQAGFMTGSGFPMPFVDENGRTLDVYQAATLFVNENGVPQFEGLTLMIDRALGPEQFFGAFVTHYDFMGRYTDILTAVALDRGLSLISASQMLEWLDGRNRSSFENLAWSGSTLTFRQHVAEGAEQADVMLPMASRGRQLRDVQCGRDVVAFRTETVKGLAYAVFPAREGLCSAAYGEAVL